MGLGHIAGVLDLGHRVFDVSAMPYTSWSLTSLAVHFDEQPDACWVACDGPRVVAFVLGSLDYDDREDWGYLEWIAVDPEYQGRGLAGDLLELSCKALFAAGATRVVTDVEQSNVASAGLMRRHGFADSVTVTLFIRDGDAPPADRPRVHRDPAKSRLHSIARRQLP
ncbi:GNAT family N-acetyltransferase [Pseudonocardiaceae bacterium YIM PH 21723]|nr:GNAT family N-acetyltransferase [Pseudonocardiaceae bacterium YIM PH 21723]